MTRLYHERKKSLFDCFADEILQRVGLSNCIVWFGYVTAHQTIPSEARCCSKKNAAMHEGLEKRWRLRMVRHHEVCSFVSFCFRWSQGRKWAFISRHSKFVCRTVRDTGAGFLHSSWLCHCFACGGKRLETKSWLGPIIFISNLSNKNMEVWGPPKKSDGTSSLAIFARGFLANDIMTWTR